MKKNIDSMILCYSNRDVFKNKSTKADHIAYAIGRTSPEPFGEEVAEFILGIPTNPSKVWGMFGSCTLMARKSVFNQVGPFDESLEGVQNGICNSCFIFRDSLYIRKSITYKNV